MTRPFGLPVTQLLFGCLVIFMLVLAVYGHTFNAPFVFDDLANISRNRFVKMEHFSWDQLGDAAFRGQSPTRPVAHVSFALNYYVSGPDAFGFRVVNVAIHAISGVFVCLISLATFRQLARSGSVSSCVPSDPDIAWMALFAGCLFVAHPLQIQAVTYLVQRMTSLAVMFYLAAFLCYLVGRGNGRLAGSWPWWCLGLLCWLMSLGTKQIAVTFPFAVLLYEWYFFRNLSSDWMKRGLKYIAVALVVSCVVAAAYMYDKGFMFPGYKVRDYTMWERLLTQSRVVVFYVSLVFYPHPGRLNLLHHFSTSHSLVDPPTTLVSVLMLVGLVVFSFCLARRRRLLSFAIVWFLLQLALESTIVPLEMAYEHRLYLPMVSVAMAVPWGLQRMFRERSWSVSVGILLAIALAIMTHMRNSTWADAVTLWSDVIAKSGESDPRSYNNRAIAYADLGKHDLAVEDHQKSLDVDPFNPMQHYSLATSYFNLNMNREAVASFSDAIALDRRLVPAYAHRGMAYYRLGDTEKALADYAKALKLDPRIVIVYQYRSALYGHLGRFDEAVADISRVIELLPRDVYAIRDRAILYQKWQKYDLAIQDFQKAIKLNPTYTAASVSLAMLWATCPEDKFRDGERAVQLAGQACQQTMESEYNALAALAAAYAELGNFDEAIHWQYKALEVAPASSSRAARARLTGYRKGLPYRTGPGEVE